MSDAPLRVGVVGLGYWGPNLARNFDALPGAELRWCCDGRADARARFARQLPRGAVHRELDDLLADADARRGRAGHAGADATPSSPCACSRRASTASSRSRWRSRSADAERAVAPPRRRGSVLMVGHLLEYHPGVRKLKEIADSGELGDIRYIYGNRLNLGQLRADENALWSLGAHDVSVVLHLAGEEPYEVSARGECYMRAGVEDVVFGFLRFPSGLAAHLHLSWLDPHKERRFTVVGSERMATFDDMDLERKITIYDKGFDETRRVYGEYIAALGRHLVARGSPNAEPLRLECEHFVDCVRSGREPRSGGAQRPARRARARGPAGLAGREPARARGSRPCASAERAAATTASACARVQHRAHRDREVRARRPRRSPAARRQRPYSAIAGWRWTGVR